MELPIARGVRVLRLQVMFHDEEDVKFLSALVCCDATDNLKPSGLGDTQLIRKFNRHDWSLSAYGTLASS